MPSRIVPSVVRRRLRQKLGTRYNRRVGTKSVKGALRARQKLALEIDQWFREGCPDVERRK